MKRMALKWGIATALLFPGTVLAANEVGGGGGRRGQNQFLQLIGIIILFIKKAHTEDK